MLAYFWNLWIFLTSAKASSWYNKAIIFAYIHLSTLSYQKLCEIQIHAADQIVFLYWKPFGSSTVWRDQKAILPTPNL